MMRVLISNDDGYQAPGIHCLFEYLSSMAKVVAVAPDRNKSGASNSLSLKQPLRVTQFKENFYYVDGTPTDCVHLALTGFLAEEPDFVISGINDSANLGDDTIYSGTVAAAMEGRHLNRPSIAVSLVSKNNEPKYFDTAARVVIDVLHKLQLKKIAKSTILNINVPDIHYDELKGYQITRLGSRHRSDPVIKSTAPNNPKEELYWIGAAGQGEDIGDGTDFNAVSQNYVSITPLQIDLTSHQQINDFKPWFD